MNDFEIRAPRWHYTLFVVTLILGVIVSIAGIVLHFANVAETIIAISFLGLFFVALSLFGIYVYKKESFILEGGLYTYNKVFKKSQSAYAKDIKVVKVTFGGGMIMKVIFYGKDGSELIDFLDDGTAFKDGRFEKSLEAYNIPLITE